MTERDERYWKKIKADVRATERYLYTVGDASQRRADPMTTRNSFGVTTVRDALDSFVADRKAGRLQIESEV